MATPPRDEEGFVTPHDDRDIIPDHSYVVRYIPHHWLIPNKNQAGTRRLSKAAFSGSSAREDRYQGMSVDVMELLVNDAVEPASRMAPEHEAAVVIQAGGLRKLGLKIGPDPMQNNDPYHASVWGVKSSQRKKIKALADWPISPSDVV